MADQTRDRIVAAAYRTLVKRGYHETSMKDIAEEAGVAPGLAHYYFESKEELLLAAIRHGCAPLIKEWEASTATPPSSVQAAIELGRQGFDLQKEELRRHRDLFGLVFDMFGVGLHNPRIAGAVNEFIQEDRERITAIARAVLPEMAHPPSASPDAIAAAIWGSLNGITLQKLIDPQFDADAAIDALAEMVFALVSSPQFTPPSAGEGRGGRAATPAVKRDRVPS
jgi:AcrR family transcriptional regulator